MAGAQRGGLRRKKAGLVKKEAKEAGDRLFQTLWDVVKI